MTQIALGDDLTIRSAEAIRARLAGALSSSSEDLVVDCRDGQAVDVTVLQLLLSAKKTADAQGRRFSLSSPAQGALLDALRRGGFLAESGGEAEGNDKFWIEGSVGA